MKPLRRARPRATTSYRVRHLSSVHNADDTRILHKECRSLAEAGHDVALISCHPRDETIAGVRVIALEFPRGRLDRMLRTGWRVLRAAWRERADIYHFHDPELIWVGLVLKLGGAAVIYDVHEDYPKQIMNKFWIPAWAKRILATAAMAMEGLGARCFDAIVTATPTIAEKFPAAKTVVVQNFPESSILGSDDGHDGSFAERPYAFVYAGGLTEMQGIREMVAAFAMLPAGLEGVLAGGFQPPELEDEMRAAPGWSRVRFTGPLPRPEAIARMREARCGIVVDHPISNYLDAYSTKMFEYMACGIPFVCSDLPLWVRLVGDADCAILVDPRDAGAIAAAIRALAEDPQRARRLGANGRRAVAERFNWEAELAKLQDVYRRVA